MNPGDAGWISPEGIWHPVAAEHRETIKQFFTSPVKDWVPGKINPNQTMWDAWDAGWISIRRYEDQINIGGKTEVLTNPRSPGILKLHELLRDMPFESVFVNDPLRGIEPDRKDFMGLYDLNKFLKFRRWVKC